MDVVIVSVTSQVPLTRSMWIAIVSNLKFHRKNPLQDRSPSYYLTSVGGIEKKKYLLKSVKKEIVSHNLNYWNFMKKLLDVSIGEGVIDDAPLISQEAREDNVLIVKEESAVKGPETELSSGLGGDVDKSDIKKHEMPISAILTSLEGSSGKKDFQITTLVQELNKRDLSTAATTDLARLLIAFSMINELEAVQRVEGILSERKDLKKELSESLIGEMTFALAVMGRHDSSLFNQVES